jgi:cysteine synthase B
VPLTISIPSPLRTYTDGHSTIEVSGKTVGSALESLVEKYPALKKQLYSDDGQLRSFVNVYLNDEDIRYLKRSETAVASDDTIAIVPSIAGGMSSTYRATDAAFTTYGSKPLALVGNTPLLRFESLTRSWPLIQILGKAEWKNPGGSVKDRAALKIIESALRSGALASGRRLLDATSGNTGIAYAMIGAAHGIPVTLCVPEHVSAERKRILTAYGAEIVWTDRQEGTDGSIRKARELYQSDPAKYFYADQYSNDANWLAHYHGTAQEIWQQTEGAVTHFVAGLGTTGTFIGTTRRLKEFNPAVRAISMQPDSALHGLEGLKHMPSVMVPRIYDPSLADEALEISTDAAYAMMKRVARSEGVLLGISAGAALAACEQVAKRIASQKEPQSAVIATVLPDSGDRYLSEELY